MTENTCAVLSAVFPLIALTVTLQRRDMHMKLRQLRFMRRASLWSTMASLVGLILVVIGVQLHGLDGLVAYLAWACGIISVAGLALTLVAVIATFENEEDDAKTDS